MALKALDIYKLLPKTNCKDCSCPTCLAFAMKLAQKQAALDECPHVSEESKSELEGSSAPPVRLITVGRGDSKLEIGNETVMFRHEETFYHPPGIGVIVSDEDTSKIEVVGKLDFVRVGQQLKVNVIAIENTSGQADTFAAAAEAAAALDIAIVLMASDPAAMEAALAKVADKKPLIHAATEANLDAMAALAKANSCPLAVSAADLDAVAALSEKAKAAGVEDLVLDVTAEKMVDTLQALTAARRHALKKSVKGLGYPCMTVSQSTDPVDNVADASAYVAKYAGIVLVRVDQPEHILPILTVSQNVYTDPRKPIQVEPGIYEVGAVTPDSPLLLTTNFSLTYYTVEGEVEASRIPAYIGVLDTEGTSVLTAFASDKMTSDSVTALLKSDAIAGKLNHKKVVLPGYIAAMSGALKEDSGWEVLVGPREASGIPKFLKTVWKNG